MPMSKQHYEAIARIVANNWGRTIGKDSQLISQLSDYFYADNVNFSAVQFSKAIRERRSESREDREHQW